MTTPGVPSQVLDRAALGRVWRGLFTVVPVTSAVAVEHDTQPNCFAVVVMPPRDDNLLFTFDPANPPNPATNYGWFMTSLANGGFLPTPAIPVVGGATVVFRSFSDTPCCIFEMLDESP